jgi:hypothetical protein
VLNQNWQLIAFVVYHHSATSFLVPSVKFSLRARVCDNCVCYVPFLFRGRLMCARTGHNVGRIWDGVLSIIHLAHAMSRLRSGLYLGENRLELTVTTLVI